MMDGDAPVGGGDAPPLVLTTVTTAENVISSQILRLNPNNEHIPDSYDDLQLDFSPFIFSSLEKYLPTNMLMLNRDEKAKFMSGILLKYHPLDEISRAKKLREYKHQIITYYPPLYKELYTLYPRFFLPSFLKAINENTEESIRSIISEPFPDVFVFEMLQPSFCEKMVSEVENFREWVNETKIKIMRPNTMSKYGAVLDDFGFDSMLDKLMEVFISPISKVFFPDIGGGTLDSHHGFVVEYGKDKDFDLGFHVDDSEVTLNVCLSKQFVGGELFFRGKRCDKHVNTFTKPEEIFDYCHRPGQAVIHFGRHRHGARATTSGHRVNMILWCRSSLFREMKNYQGESLNWCGYCLQEKTEEKRQNLDDRRKELIRIESEDNSQM